MTSLLSGLQFFEDDFPIFLNRETEAFATPRHRHDFIELSLVAEGRGFHYIEDGRMEVQQGDLFLLPLGTSHVFRPTSPDGPDPLVLFNCIFDLAALERLKEWIPRDSQLHRLLYQPAGPDPRWFHYTDKRGQFLSLIHQAYVEFSDRPSGYRTMVTAILLQILQLLHRAMTEPRQAPLPAELPLEKIDDALFYIDKHYSDKITLKAAADRSYMSVGHFQNQFKKATGVTFNHYVQNVRIQKCCQLLKSTDKSVQQTANEVGYTDMKFFHSLFRKLTGSSPQQYRRV